MAIDAAISLGVQAPQIAVQIPQPLQQFGQIMSLRDMMAQQQLRQAQMQNVAAEMQDRQYKLDNAQKFQALYAPGKPEPTPSDVYGALGAEGTKVVQEMLANRAADFKNRSDHLGRLSSYASTILNDPKGLNDFTYQYNVKQAVANGDLDEATGNEMLKHSVTDPQVQTQLRTFATNALGAKEQQDYWFNQADNAHKLASEAAAAGQAQQKQLGEGLANFAAGIGQVKDPATWAAYLQKAPPDVQKFYSGVAWGPDTAGIVSLAGVKPEAGKTFPTPASVQQSQVEQTQAIELAKKAAEMQAYQPVIQSVMRGEQRLQDLPADIQSKIAPGLIMGGYQGFGKLISDAERERLGDYDRASTVLQQTLDKIANPENAAMMGPFMGQFARYPKATDTRVLRSDLVTQQQQLKKFITNGSLRGLTPDTLDMMFPTITTDPEEAKQKIQHLQATIAAEKHQYLRDLSDKVIPTAVKGPATTTQASPSAAAASPAAAGLPGKVHVKRPDGQTGYINESALPQMLKQGYVQIP